MWTTGKYYWKNVVNTITPKCNTPSLCTLPSVPEVWCSSSLNRSAYGVLLLELFQLSINMTYLLAVLLLLLFLINSADFSLQPDFTGVSGAMCVHSCMDVNQLHLLYFRRHLSPLESTSLNELFMFVYSIFAREHVSQLHCCNPTWKSAVVA